jgi:hypothetical protein
MQKRTMLIRAGGDISPQHNCTLHANAPTSALLILMGAMRCALRNATRSERGASLPGCRFRGDFLNRPSFSLFI